MSIKVQNSITDAALAVKVWWTCRNCLKFLFLRSSAVWLLVITPTRSALLIAQVSEIPGPTFQFALNRWTLLIWSTDTSNLTTHAFSKNIIATIRMTVSFNQFMNWTSQKLKFYFTEYQKVKFGACPQTHNEIHGWTDFWKTISFIVNEKLEKFAHILSTTCK